MAEVLIGELQLRWLRVDDQEEGRAMWTHPALAAPEP